MKETRRLGLNWSLALGITVLTLTHMVGTCESALFAIEDARPNLASADTEVKVLQWWGGGPAYLLASARAVRINFRGVHTYSRSARIREIKGISGWRGSACNVSAWAMCASESGQVLPWANPRMPETQASVPVDWLRTECGNTQGKVLVSEGVYDITACDILDEGLDIVYSEGMLFHARTALPIWRYWVCVTLTIVLVRALSYNVRGLWSGDDKSKPTDTTKSRAITLGASIALVLLVLIDLDHVYITQADQVYFWSSVFYVGCYSVMHGAVTLQTGTANHHQPVFNVIVGALLVFAIRLYTSAETPYNLLLTGMLACRTWTKLLMTPQQRVEHSPSLLLDSLFVSLCVELGSNNSRKETMVAVIGVAFVAAQLLGGHTGQRF